MRRYDQLLLDLDGCLWVGEEAVEGAPEAVAALLEQWSPPGSAEVLGPVPLGEPDAEGRTERERALIRVPRPDGWSLAASLAAAQASRVARKETSVVRIQLDPLELV